MDTPTIAEVVDALFNADIVIEQRGIRMRFNLVQLREVKKRDGLYQLDGVIESCGEPERVR